MMQTWVSMPRRMMSRVLFWVAVVVCLDGRAERAVDVSGVLVLGKVK